MTRKICASKLIYLDNAATTWPKPIEIEQVANNFFKTCFVSPNRTDSLYDFIEQIRKKILRYFDVFSDDYEVVLLPSATIVMNVVIQSIDGHIVTTNCEHHAVYRPLYTLNKNFDVVNFLDHNQNQHPEKIFEKINNRTRAVIVNHGSNVTGDIFDVGLIGKYLKTFNKEILFIVDISQTIGIEDISIEDLNADVVIGSAHKHLYGLPGVGFCVKRKKEKLPFKPLYFGGTGKFSSEMKQPKSLPELLESGTFDTIALLALEKSIELSTKIERKKNRIYENLLLEHFMNKCKEIEEIKIFRGKNKKRTGVLSFTVNELDPTYVVSHYLTSRGILMRSGLHCAPLIHKAICTYPAGTNRLSVSKYNTKEELGKVVTVLKDLIVESR